MWPSIIIYKKLIGVIWPKSIEADVPLQFFRQYVRCPQQEASLMCGTDCFILFLFQQNHPCERSSLLQVLKRWAAPLFRKPPKHPDLAKAHADERHTLSLCCWTEILSWCGIWIWGLQFPCFSLFAHQKIFSTYQNIFSFPWAEDFATAVADSVIIYSSQEQFLLLSTKALLQQYISLKAAITILIWKLFFY